MKIARVGVWVLSLWALGGFAEAALPKPVSLLARTTTSQSQGTYGLRSTKYNKAAWGNRWHQSLARPPVNLAPYVRKF